MVDDETYEMVDDEMINHETDEMVKVNLTSTNNSYFILGFSKPSLHLILI